MLWHIKWNYTIAIVSNWCQTVVSNSILNMVGYCLHDFLKNSHNQMHGACHGNADWWISNTSSGHFERWRRIPECQWAGRGRWVHTPAAQGPTPPSRSGNWPDSLPRSKSGRHPSWGKTGDGDDHSPPMGKEYRMSTWAGLGAIRIGLETKVVISFFFLLCKGLQTHSNKSLKEYSSVFQHNFCNIYHICCVGVITPDNNFLFFPFTEKSIRNVFTPYSLTMEV